MGSLADLLPPGTDLCQIPSGMPPAGQFPNFNDPGLKSLTIAFAIIPTVIAVTLATGRLIGNIRKLELSDLFVLLAAIANIAHAVLSIIYVRYFRHQWDVPLCWINGYFERGSYIFELLTIFSLIFSKTATLLLFRRVFDVSRAIGAAIWFGIAVAFVLYMASIVALSYSAAPHIGQTWDELAAQVAGTTIFPLYFAVAQGAVGTLLDLYIFALPLPILYKLNLSRKRKFQLSALFFVAILGVIGSVLSLAYRSKSILPNPDLTYNAGVLLNCNLVEMNVALVVCSTPAFASFMRSHVMHSRLFKSLRSTLGGSGGSSRSNVLKSMLDPNRPRTGRDITPKQKKHHYYEMGDTWLLHTGATVDVEAPKIAQTRSVENSEGLKVVKTVDVDHSPTTTSS
ncbi:hypothetical protein GGR50DRAFT_561892 [Xylaria sp. CBS 124048]|nr:hypothetical protein GGR50DRAFT_561892 [Xylaria sp. CBS 124048]